MPNKPKPKQRSWIPERKPHQRLINNSWFYNSYKWRKFIKGYKDRHPLCNDCNIKGIATPTTVCDHKHQYKAGAPGWDLTSLNDHDYNPLCNHHHNSRSGRQAHGLE